MRFPIDLDYVIEGLTAGPTTLRLFLQSIKDRLPYTYRYQKAGQFEQQVVTVPTSAMTANAAFRLASSAIPDDWQIVALQGYVIMYPDSPTSYESAWRYYRGGTSIDAQPVVDTAHPITEDTRTEGADDGE